MQISTNDVIGEIHVVPIEDERGHQILTVCTCVPHVSFDKNFIIVVHNSFDGREVIEWVNKEFELDAREPGRYGWLNIKRIYGEEEEGPEESEV